MTFILIVWRYLIYQHSGRKEKPLAQRKFELIVCVFILFVANRIYLLTICHHEEPADATKIVLNLDFACLVPNFLSINHRLLG